MNTVNLSAGKNKFPGDRFGFSIASREKDDVILIGTTLSRFSERNVVFDFDFYNVIIILVAEDIFRSISYAIIILL